MRGLSFVTLLAFDYRYSYDVIRSYYDIADEIILGVDADRLSWMRKPFEIDMGELRSFIGRIDGGSKIRVIEGNFHAHDHPMHNEVHERTELARACAAGNWVIQIDSDEVLMNGAEFRGWVQSGVAQGCLMAPWISVFKQFGEFALVVSPVRECAPIGTLVRGRYMSGRMTDESRMVAPLTLLHYSWGRQRGELQQKLENWGHAFDFDGDRFLRFWDSVTLENFQQFRDFHPLNGPEWPGLVKIRIVRENG